MPTIAVKMGPDNGSPQAGDRAGAGGSRRGAWRSASGKLLMVISRDTSSLRWDEWRERYRLGGLRVIRGPVRIWMQSRRSFFRNEPDLRSANLFVFFTVSLITSSTSRVFLPRVLWALGDGISDRASRLEGPCRARWKMLAMAAGLNWTPFFFFLVPG